MSPGRRRFYKIGVCGIPARLCSHSREVRGPSHDPSHFDSMVQMWKEQPCHGLDSAFRERHRFLRRRRQCHVRLISSTTRYLVRGSLESPVFGDCIVHIAAQNTGIPDSKKWRSAQCSQSVLPTRCYYTIHKVNASAHTSTSSGLDVSRHLE